MDHVSNMLDRIAGLEARDQLRNPALVRFAAFFHDVIYDARAKDNEARSADMWRSFAEDATSLSPSEVDLVYGYIVRTANHMAGEASGDLAHFLDTDLAILGTPPHKYAAYARQVRMEYAHIPPAQFVTGRVNFLSKFLQTERLFFTEEAAAEMEAVARINITAEIDRLRRRITP